jgi:diguanylate cyclase (GGDEF)-like protein
MMTAVPARSVLNETQELRLDGRGTARLSSYLVQIYPAQPTNSLIPLDAAEVRIGRDPLSEVEIFDDFASRCHAILRPEAAGTRLYDCGSRNGTFVNGTRVSDCLLVAGDHVRIGNHIFKFLAADHVEAQYHQAVYEMMTSDGLTRTANRRAFEDAFQRELLRAVRHRRPLTLLLIDVDHFKQINDCFGHLVGDDCLRELCDRVRLVVRGDDVFGRLGGEEFAVLLAETNLLDGCVVAERIRLAVAAESFAAERELAVPMTVSIGVSGFDGSELVSSDQLLSDADRRLYAAKSAGRNTVRSLADELELEVVG